MTDNDCFAGGGNMGALMRRLNWAATPLGPVEHWPQSLRTAVSIMLASGFPMLVLWGPDYIQLYNDAYRPVLGATKHPAALGQRARECWPEIWDDVLGPMWGAVMAGGEPIWSEDLLFVLDRNGYVEETYFTFSYSAIRDESGHPGGILCTCVETTGRVLGERRLRTLRELASHASGSQSVDDTRRLVTQTLSANPYDLPLVSLHLAGEPMPDAWPVAEAMATGQPQLVTDVVRRIGSHAGGAWPDPVQSAIVLPIAPSAQAPALGALVAGISPRREFDVQYRTFFDLVAAQIATAINAARAYEVERERAEALAQIDRAKTTFFSNISHEFRTPLTLMLAPTEDALASPDRVLAGDDLETVYRNQRRLLKLVNALLDFSRIEAGRADACYEPTDLALLTSDLASAFRSAIERGGIRFDVHCPPLGEPIYVDRQMWEKIVLNLLSNAFKFTFEGTIRVALVPGGSGRVELVVADTGVGIPESERTRVFERFHRVEGARGRTHEGSGIGLALVHDLVELHGGTIRVDSRVGKGTTFTVSIPTGTAHLPADRINAAPRLSSTAMAADAFVDEALRWLPPAAASMIYPPPVAAADTERTRQGRILVVDDNADIREYLGRLLGAYWTVELAADGDAALECIQSHTPDLVVADVMMPGLDGFALMRALRTDPRTSTVPVVMLSARAGDEARLDALGQGANDYIVKPFSSRELVVRINAQLAQAEYARERQALLLREQTARREAQLQKEHLELLFMSFPAPICILRGPEFVVELANPAMCDAWGRTHDQVIGRPLFDALPETRDQSFREFLTGVMQTGVPYVGTESEARLNRGPGGTLQSAFFNFVYAPMRNVHGAIEGILVVAMDITDQVAAREQMDSLRHQAESANRAKDEFLAMLGHELRNPLAPILTALQLMKLRGDESAAKERAVIDRQVRHLVRLVDDLLDVSRIARGKIELRKDRVELAEIVARAIEMASPMFEERQQTLTVHVPRTGLPLSADATRLAQVVMNLLTNASKYTEPRGRITVRARTDRRSVELTIRDTGIGIPAELLPHVFDLFVQGSQALDRSQGGLGLGLTIVRSLVELHGGTVRARSAGPGQGSEFIIRLPALEPSATQAAPSAPVGVDDAKAQVRVLVVDDNLDAGQMLADALSLLGYTTRMATDGPSAIDIASDFQPDVALVDLGLPVMDGYELAQHLRTAAGRRPLVLVAVTGYGQDTDRERSRAAGFRAHVVKPVDLQQLNRVLEDVAADALAGRLPAASGVPAASQTMGSEPAAGADVRRDGRERTTNRSLTTGGPLK